MDFLFIGLMMLALWLIVSNAPKPSKVSHDKVIKVVREKFCPPHQWGWVEMVDQNGVKVGEKMICKLCGPLRSSSDE